VEYRTILYGNKVLVSTDHRNLTFNRLSSQRALRWRLLAEEFNITLIFRPGASNLEADAVSRLPLQDAEEPTAITELEKNFMTPISPCLFSQLSPHIFPCSSILSNSTNKRIPL